MSRPATVLFERQRQALLLLEALGGEVGNVDFQKLLFLYCQENSATAPYEFVPYKFGAFSFTSYADRRKLVEGELLDADDSQWRLTEAGRTALKRTDKSAATAFAQRHRSMRGDALVAATYRQFPYYATRSEIAARVLDGDRVALQNIERAAPSPKATIGRVCTIGYEGRTLENYLNALLAAGVTLLCDVRRNPISRKYGFSKSTLANGCAGVGIRYEHLRELGIDSEQRQSLVTQADYDALFADYERHSLPLQRSSLQQIVAWLKAGQRVALTCYESLPQQCHRHCVAETLEAEMGKRFTALHL
ncbi:MAG TPA: DUF488 family protein [Kofleriaceae bacterium]|nr:DUF488 family protein [Kofleriaceae bacterium]